ncbi:hypothetical protein Esti_005245 [Eimeria stiedai]
MWSAFASFIWWSLVFPLLLLNLLFLCLSSRRTIWQSPSWPVVSSPPHPATDQDSDSLDETEASSSSSSSSREDSLADAEAKAAACTGSSLSGSSRSTSINRGPRRARRRRPLKGDKGDRPSSSSSGGSGGRWKRDRSLSARVRSYLALRFTSFLLPGMWLVNIFLTQQLLQRLYRLLLQQQQRLGVTDVLLGVYGLYALFCVVSAETMAEKLSLPSAWFRRLRVWREAAEYFPISVVTETPNASYPTDKSYLIGFHPHGVLSLSCTLSWGTMSDWEWLNVTKLLSGLDYRLTTLSMNMRLPFWSHILQAVGFISSSKKSIKDFVSRGPGRAVLIVVGGAKEAVLGGGGSNDLVLWRRKGFFEIALQTGSWLIPVFSLGENEMYHRIAGEGLGVRCFNWLSRQTMALFGFTLPACYGRGLLQLTMPKRVKILQVIGDPIPCPHVPYPSQEDIQELRRRYCEAVHRLYEKAKMLYGPDGRFGDLRIVE